MYLVNQIEASMVCGGECECSCVIEYRGWAKGVAAGTALVGITESIEQCAKVCIDKGDSWHINFCNKIIPTTEKPESYYHHHKHHH